ncbi:hypothetical protein ACOMHN_030212 [Nucella lapillus]
MGPKKRSYLGRSTYKTRHKKEARAKESKEQHTLSQVQNRARTSARRAAETTPTRRARLDDSQARMATRRAAETSPTKRARLDDSQARMATRRAAETSPTKRACLDDNNTRMAAIRRAVWENTMMSAFHYDYNIDYETNTKVAIGKMDQVCTHCGALKWKRETPGMCCAGGKVRLPPFGIPPVPLKSLLTGTSPDSKNFLDNLRNYNNCFQMTSFGVTKEFVREQGFIPTFKVHGQVYHSIGSLLPAPGNEPEFLHIYFMGNDQEQAEQRSSVVPGLRQDIVFNLQEMLHTSKTTLDRMPTDEMRVNIHANRAPQSEHEPTTDEVAILIVSQQFEKRDIVIQKRDSSLQRVSETHTSYDALQYPLMFWAGQDGYNLQVKYTNGKVISAMDFYSYLIMERGDDNHILKFRQLLNQFLVDMFAKVETERLLYIRLNQKQLRVEKYEHLRDALNSNEGNVGNLGRLVILPSSFTDGPRYMHEYTQDALTYVRLYGTPDLFITFTCNPKWEEIQSALKPGQKAIHRYDLVDRVFRQKVVRLMDLINKGNIFGPRRCYMYSVEWQKRGLPHVHILVWLQEKIRPMQIDSVISAEIQNKEEDPLLHQVVVNNMIHGPCGHLNHKSHCMKNHKCTKSFPRQLLKETQTGANGYPLYMRRSEEDGGYTYIMERRGQESIKIDNRWVVPYCPLLSRIFNSHINVEYCNSVKSIKYICKYVNKGSDQAIFSVQVQDAQLDEISSYQEGRYICTSEAVWRILNFHIHEGFPSVMTLDVHLENGEIVYFTEATALQRAAEERPKTKLTAFFNLCSNDDFARTLMYCEIPKYYTWQAGNKSRKQTTLCIHENCAKITTIQDSLIFS